MTKTDKVDDTYNLEILKSLTDYYLLEIQKLIKLNEEIDKLGEELNV